MAKATGHNCDRCTQHMTAPAETFKLDNQGVIYELCTTCSISLGRFLANEKTYEGRFKEIDYCPHHIPCAGPCKSHYVKCTDGEGYR